MPSEQTILEGPVTPAPVFAYRAFKGIFFGSPDSSPEHDDKENIPIIQTSPTKSMSPTKRSQTRFTPQKSSQSNSLLSPTKSCLRTPGIPTPRAKLLRDMNVKFKSVSPEARLDANRSQKNELNVEEQQYEVPKSNPSNAVADDSNREKRKKTTNVTKPVSNSQVNAPNSTTSTAEPLAMVLANDFEEYKRQTEKEMKKLVRYSQKLREYARKQDEENLELRKLLEETQRENDRLRKSEIERNSSTSSRGTRTIVDSKTSVPRASLPTMETKSRKLARPVSMSAINTENISLRNINQPRQTTSTQPTGLGRSKSMTIQKPSTQDESDDRANDQPYIKDSEALNPNLPIRPIRPASIPSSSKFAPEKLAAARERLRKKAELRKASAHESSGSQLDWLAI